jgi:hypothetical protein
LQLAGVAFGVWLGHLMMGVCSSKRQALAFVTTDINSFMGLECAIVSMVVLHLDAPIEGAFFECDFAFESFVSVR